MKHEYQTGSTMKTNYSNGIKQMTIPFQRLPKSESNIQKCFRNQITSTSDHPISKNLSGCSQTKIETKYELASASIREPNTCTY